ncbi:MULTISPECIES: hypothetical protein [unclassified Rhodococcus (in: high G+C Gram-positive bacteria)]|uniref:hypothetical protein n=1 Tax=unclassified Rhodococcus (in: high G+C Gram-positive bacteria) TaxID=192944 RepID=UPI00163A1352|nr:MULTISPECIES: hypothetical protein [unclassified Rhodococcus (in: high G+C Gram-positive bacteria)]MBC2644452.1 hypothetical protein [Rhodococcus sp. 3A]MBC2897860.1 hypothetical protein [Rhodococcus sp. 4CII]
MQGSAIGIVNIVRGDTDSTVVGSRSPSGSRCVLPEHFFQIKAVCSGVSFDQLTRAVNVPLPDDDHEDSDDDT